jgi:hypothetical protein
VTTTEAIDPVRLARSMAAEPGSEVAVVDLPAGRAVRRVSRRRPQLDTGDAEITSTVLDYHLPVPGRRRSLLRLTFSSPLPSPIVEAAMELWDAMVSTLTWSDDEQADERGAGDVRQEG